MVCLPVCVSRPSADEYSSKPFVYLGNSLFYGKWLILASRRLGLGGGAAAFLNDEGREKPSIVGLLLWRAMSPPRVIL